VNTAVTSPELAALILIVGTTFAGCASSHHTQPVPQVKTGLVMIPADQVKYYQPDPDANTRSDQAPASAPIDTRSVQMESEVTAIQLNRYADPACPNELMHEAHIVYRRDTGPRWRLTAPAGEQQILIGPQMTDGRGEIKGLAAPEVDAYLREQRATLRRQEETISKITDTLRQLADQQKQISEQLAHVDGRQREEHIPPTSNRPEASAPAQTSAASHHPREQPPITAEEEPSEIPER
jgi:hypothetical protein